MSPMTSWSSAGAAGRGGHLDRLHGNLLDLDERLRDAVAQAIGQAAAGVVRQVVLSLLGQADDAPMLLRASPRPGSPSRPLWETLDEPRSVTARPGLANTTRTTSSRTTSP
ncbi:MAG TPA: hypothetical protein VEL76_34770 [Gemmataceae bacterium]|nr:hypothetical protein [Gemmataceae bacterium]